VLKWRPGPFLLVKGGSWVLALSREENLFRVRQPSGEKWSIGGKNSLHSKRKKRLKKKETKAVFSPTGLRGKKRPLGTKNQLE